MGHVTCRVPDGLSERYENGAEERGAFQSEVVRRALRYYAEKNPDGLQAFTADSGRTRRADQAERREVQEARVDPAEAAEKEQQGEPGDTPGSAVYDPTSDA